jgi:hypothetical protein
MKRSHQQPHRSRGGMVKRSLQQPERSGAAWWNAHTSSPNDPGRRLV